MESLPLTFATLAGLLALSALFSSAETALFKLTPGEARRAGTRVERLVATPRDLLIAVLFGNLVVNLLFFSVVARLASRLDAKLLVGFGALVAILIFGEILPKSLGLVSSVRIARFCAPALALFVRLTSPVRHVMGRLLELVGHTLGEAAREDKHMRPEDLEQFFAKSAESGHLLSAEADLLVEIAELESIDVRQIMTPRVDALFVELDGENRDEVAREAAKRRLARLPVIDGQVDAVVGQVRVRDLFIFPERGVDEMTMPVPFVPEVASSLDALHSLRAKRAAEAVVVDEWGGTAGVVTLEDIFEELVGELRVEGEAREVTVVPLGEGRFRVAGSLSMHDWNDDFGFDVVPAEFETVGGFVTALFGRIPRVGDEVRHGDLVFEVHEVRERRVVWVDMQVAAGSSEVLEHQPALGSRRDRR
jgi:CBS domain containing-hemolysin-like protein